MHAKQKSALLADLGLFYAAAIWGSTFFLVKYALSGIDPVIMVGYRFLLAGGILAVYLLIRRQNLLLDLKKGLFLAIILWSLYIPQTIGLKYTTASNSGFITGLFVAFVPIFMKTLFRKSPTVMEIIASVVALAGLWILTGGMKEINTGDLLTLIAAMTYALHLLLSDKYMKQQIEPLRLACQQFLIVGLLSLVTALIFRLPFGITTTAALNITIFLALFPTMTAFVIQLLAQKITSPLRVSLIFALEPVFAGLFAWTLGGEIVQLHGLIGGLLIFAALILSGLPSKPLAKN
ncbi:Drug/metabolite transporter (DMT) superfamily permease [Candidatus Zixiibacteriota bacterium]|nr:Drug/metabolite transporter (DMT) superfamily permease [candidate division Zixibacteria bacterium]